MIKRLFLVVLLGALISWGCQEKAGSQSKLITPQELQELSTMEGVQLVDVRTPEEYSEGYIEGFQNIDFLADTFEENIKKLDKSKPVIVYCRSGKRSGRCARQMLEAGFEMIYDLEGGISKWMYEGFEVTGTKE